MAILPKWERINLTEPTDALPNARQSPAEQRVTGRLSAVLPGASWAARADIVAITRASQPGRRAPARPSCLS